jgi:hypothetical protein
MAGLSLSHMVKFIAKEIIQPMPSQRQARD